MKNAYQQTSFYINKKRAEPKKVVSKLEDQNFIWKPLRKSRQTSLEIARLISWKMFLGNLSVLNNEKDT